MDKPDLILINNHPKAQMPTSALNEFKVAVTTQNKKPSVALRELMENYDCPKPDPFLVLKMVETAYPDIDVMQRGFKSYLIDGGYPECTAEFTDEDFDNGIAEIKELPPGW